MLKRDEATGLRGSAASLKIYFQTMLSSPMCYALIRVEQSRTARPGARFLLQYSGTLFPFGQYDDESSTSQYTACIGRNAIN
jgi:hypothetical protein